ncbi:MULTISPECIES: sirohydrochlorin chelatase [unclassified Rhizobacter]|uniref:sirohydrochlorin chelatase n=1 Tax=unclassified Rhizobacter TaxID=2640088 RepID=UPI0006F54101|nr:MULTISPECIES: sirohydrochlorin chelatase [unclassified Rhizobacter]KQU77232.1 cobalamin biosynthesis protein CbiX [Rhizobacter sp. Root29]KQW12696.1 cobalamin biosynthesis protein CbiX [Rhizobacter sp. Root1238]KRB22283.1 cobalamin biosynthesis protein CbiX [Rhizobacter sp. Root16D2]
MNDTILLVGHGSREKSGNDEIERFTQLWRARHPQWRTELCFIEFAEIEVEEGLDRAATGAERVIVVPLILNAAGHVNVEIPSHIARARQRHAGVRFDYAPHLGVCEPVLDVLRRQLKQCMHALDMPDPTGTGVVLLGRGSSNREANGEMARMARWLFEDGDHELVDLAFTGIAWPRLERVVQRQVQLGMRQVIVLPYYLFTGTLIQRIGRQVEHLRAQYPQVRFASGTHFGFEPEIAQLLAGRVDALMHGALAAVPVSEEAAQWEAHHHGHDHAHHAAHEHAHEHAHPHDHAHAHDHAEHGH